MPSMRGSRSCAGSEQTSGVGDTLGAAVMAGSQSSITDREVVQAACALHGVGSTDEAIALLRGAVKRDAGQDACRALLDRLEGGEAPEIPGDSLELDFELVDSWIRRGMLVEALAVLGGTSLGSGDKGREWANLLGELMAPVPADAEDTLVQMHAQLMSGGASVALTLLEERDRRVPVLPAWACRRLALLRWMLLDNASAAETAELEAPASELAGVLGASLKRRGLLAALEAVRALISERPDHQDAARVLAALESLHADVTSQVKITGGSHNTVPMVGHMAAVMQVRMGNLENSRSLYQGMIDKEGDERAAVLLAEIEVLIAALAGEALFDDDLAGEVTQLRPVSGLEPPFPMTKETRLPEESGKVVVTEMGAPEGAEVDRTTELPTASFHAEQLADQGRLAEAEEIYRGLASLQPEQPELLRRAEELGRLREGGAVAASGVLVRVILPVK